MFQTAKTLLKSLASSHVSLSTSYMKQFNSIEHSTARHSTYTKAKLLLAGPGSSVGTLKNQIPCQSGFPPLYPIDKHIVWVDRRTGLQSNEIVSNVGNPTMSCHNRRANLWAFVRSGGGSPIVLRIYGIPHSGYVAVCSRAVTVAPDGICASYADWLWLLNICGFALCHYHHHHHQHQRGRTQSNVWQRTHLKHYGGVEAAKASKYRSAQQGGKLKLHVTTMKLNEWTNDLWVWVRLCVFKVPRKVRSGQQVEYVREKVTGAKWKMGVIAGTGCPWLL